MTPDKISDLQRLISNLVLDVLPENFILHLTLVNLSTNDVHMCTNAVCERCIIDAITISSQDIRHNHIRETPLTIN